MGIEPFKPKENLDTTKKSKKSPVKIEIKTRSLNIEDEFQTVGS